MAWGLRGPVALGAGGSQVDYKVLVTVLKDYSELAAHWEWCAGRGGRSCWLANLMVDCVCSVKQRAARGAGGRVGREICSTLAEQAG